MDVVAVVALASSVDEEAPRLAVDLRLTAYETAVMLRAPMPVIVLRSEDRARVLEVLGKLRGRRHEAIACELGAVVSSESMFRPRSFRFEGSDFVGVGSGEEHRLPLGNVFALIRAIHVNRLEETITVPERRLSLGRAAVTGGLLMTKVTQREGKRLADEREGVLYVFPVDGTPWLLHSTHMRYDGLGHHMRVSQVENFDVLITLLRQLCPSAAFDARLLAIRAAVKTTITAGVKSVAATSADTIDVLAHIVALANGRAARPYRC